MNLGERALLNNAEEQEAWLYKPSTKEWFSPKELQKLIQNNVSIETTDYVIKDPIEALMTVDKQIADLIERRNKFQYRLIKASIMKPF